MKSEFSLLIESAVITTSKDGVFCSFFLPRLTGYENEYLVHVSEEFIRLVLGDSAVRFEVMEEGVKNVKRAEK